MHLFPNTQTGPMLGLSMSQPADHLDSYPRVLLTLRPLTWIRAGLSARSPEPADENPWVFIHPCTVCAVLPILLPHQAAASPWRPGDVYNYIDLQYLLHSQQYNNKSQIFIP